MLLRIILQRIKENKIVIEISIFALFILGFFFRIAQKKTSTFKIFSQIHRTTIWNRIKSLIEPYIKKNLYLANGTERFINGSNILKFIGKRILVVKYPQSGFEKGILYIKFSEIINKIPSVFDLSRLLKDYTLVLEPSWSGYCEEGLLQYCKFEDEIYVQSPEEKDFRFLKDLNSNLVPIRIGPCDWVDPRIAKIALGQEKKFDIIMNSHWGSSKRHYLLFKTLRGLPSNLRIALIGVPWSGGTIYNIKKLAEYYGVSDQITYFERIPYKDVMKITGQAKLGLLLSLKEGANRAVSEYFFCDIPAILLAEHVGGIRKNITPETGVIAREKMLKSTILSALNNLERFSPRKWALQNISCFESTKRVNAVIKSRAVEKGQHWSRDIAPKTNSPEPQYCYKRDYLSFSSYNKKLVNYIK